MTAITGELLIPEYMRAGVRRYLDHGVRPGRFLYCVLSNDFLTAYLAADETNQLALSDWAAFLTKWCPEESYGSREKVEAWIAKGGSNG